MVDGGFELHKQSRYARVAKLDRRRFIKTASATGLAAFLAACSGDDAATFAQAEEEATGVSAGAGTAASDADAPALRVGDASATASDISEPADGSTTASSDADGSTSSTADNSSSTTGQTTTSQTTTESTQTASTTTQTTAGGSGAALPAGASMTVGFTYEQQSGGKSVPPYIAVWVEDSAGNLLQTVSLWYQQSGRGDRWLPDLRRWYNVDQQRVSNGGADNVDAISGATRSPGSFQVRWDGKANGRAVPVGSYFVCIESARERGRYSLIRQSINLNGSGLQQSLSRDGELVDASVAVA